MKKTLNHPIYIKMQKYLNILRKNNESVLSSVYKEIHKSGFFEEAIKLNSLSNACLKKKLEITNKNLKNIGKENILVSIDESHLTISIKKEQITINVSCTTSNIYNANQLKDFNFFIKECSFLITKKMNCIDEAGRNKEIKVVYSHSDIKNEITVFYSFEDMLKQFNSLRIIVMERIQPKYIFKVEQLPTSEKAEIMDEVKFSLFEKIPNINNIEDYLEHILDYLFLNVEIEQNKKDMLFLSEDMSEMMIHSCDEYLLNLNDCYEN